METRRSLLRRLKLRTILVVVLLLSGIIPLIVSSVLLIRQSNKVLFSTEQDNLTSEAGSLAREVNTYLADIRRQLAQLGTGIVAAPGPEDATARLQGPWVGEQLTSFQQSNPDVLSLRVLTPEGNGLVPGNLPPEVKTAMDAVFNEARSSKAPAYGFVPKAAIGKPQAILAVPVPGGAAGPQLIVEAQLRFGPLEKLTKEDPGKGVEVVLLDRQAKILWTNKAASLGPQILKALGNLQMTMTRRYTLPTPKGNRDVFAQVSAIDEGGWSLVVQKPVSEAFADVDP